MTSGADRGGVKLEGDMVLIRLPQDQVHALRVALEPCPCKATKSTSTEGIRAKLSKALAKYAGRPRA